MRYITEIMQYNTGRQMKEAPFDVLLLPTENETNNDAVVLYLISMAFDAFRDYGGPTQHGDNKNAVTVDVLEIGFIFAFCLVFFCFVIISPGYKGKLWLYFIIRTVISLFIGCSILLGVLGQDWVSGEITTKTPYKAFTKTEVKAHIGAKIGLGSVNITLTGTPIHQVVADLHQINQTIKFQERIDYNERFHWAWRQGRFGFGPYSGEIAQQLRAAQFKGLPLPILWIAEYFVLDGELIRWGRSFRTAGWFTWQLLWTAIPLWIIANILSLQVLFYSGFMFILTGLTMASSLVIYVTIRWGTQPLVIPFEDDVLTFHFGSSFWLVVAGAVTSFLYGFMMVVMDWFWPQKIATFFNVDVLQDFDEFYHQTNEEEENETNPDVENGSSYYPQYSKGGGGVQKRHVPKRLSVFTAGSQDSIPSLFITRISSNTSDCIAGIGGIDLRDVADIHDTCSVESFELRKQGGNSRFQSLRRASSRRPKRLPRKHVAEQVIENEGFVDIATSSA